jgi:hypothetical protein
MCALAFPPLATADPVRITVTFTPTGSPADPDFGAATGTGTFSFVTNESPGTDVFRPEGFGLETMSLTWAGVNWDTTNSDIYRIGRELDDRVFAFSVGGTPAGLDLSTAVPDFRLLFCIAGGRFARISDCSNINFEYSTLRSTTLGPFTGSFNNLSVLTEPLADPVPEPMTLLLVRAALAPWRLAADFRRKDELAGGAAPEHLCYGPRYRARPDPTGAPAMCTFLER